MPPFFLRSCLSEMMTVRASRPMLMTLRRSFLEQSWDATPPGIYGFDQWRIQ